MGRSESLSHELYNEGDNCPTYMIMDGDCWKQVYLHVKNDTYFVDKMDGEEDCTHNNKSTRLLESRYDRSIKDVSR